MKKNCFCLKVPIIYTRVNVNLRSRELKGTAKYLFVGGIHMGTRTKYLACVSSTRSPSHSVLMFLSCLQRPNSVSLIFSHPSWENKECFILSLEGSSSLPL